MKRLIDNAPNAVLFLSPAFVLTMMACNPSSELRLAEDSGADVARPGSDAGNDSATDVGNADAQSDAQQDSGRTGNSTQERTSALCTATAAKYQQCDAPFNIDCDRYNEVFDRDEATRETNSCQLSAIYADFFDCAIAAPCGSFVAVPNGAGRISPSGCEVERQAINAEFSNPMCTRYNSKNLNFPNPGPNEVRLIAGPEPVVQESLVSTFYRRAGEYDSFVVQRFQNPAAFTTSSYRIFLDWNDGGQLGCDIANHPQELWLVVREASSTLDSIGSAWTPSSTTNHVVYQSNQLRTFSGAIPLPPVRVNAGQVVDVVFRTSSLGNGLQSCPYVATNTTSASSRERTFKFQNNQVVIDPRWTNPGPTDLPTTEAIYSALFGTL